MPFTVNNFTNTTGSLFYSVLDFINDLYKICPQQKPLSDLINEFLASDAIKTLHLYSWCDNRFVLCDEMSATDIFKKVLNIMDSTQIGISSEDRNALKDYNLFLFLPDIYEYDVVKNSSNKELWWLPSNNYMNIASALIQKMRVLEQDNQHLREKISQIISTNRSSTDSEVSAVQLQQIKLLKNKNREMDKRIKKLETSYQEGQGDSLLILGAVMSVINNFTKDNYTQKLLLKKIQEIYDGNNISESTFNKKIAESKKYFKQKSENLIKKS